MQVVGVTRAWLLGTVRASAVSLLVPAGIFIALATVVVGGGLGGLGSLDQLLSGPRLPAPAQLTSRAGRPISRPALPTIPARGSASALRARARRGRVGLPPAPAHRRAPRLGVERRPAHGERPVGRPAPGPASGGGSGRPVSASSPGAGHAPPPSPGPVQQVGQQAQGAAATLPGPVGPAASGAIGTVVQLVPPSGHLRR